MKIGFKFSVNSMAGLTLLCLLQGTSFAKESGASEVLDDIVAYFGVVPSEIIGTHNPNHTEATFMAGYPRTSVLTSWSLLCL
jgi:hypothetical protein